MSDALLKNTFNKISPAYELVADVTIATATTQVDFSGFNFGKDDDLMLVCDLVSGDTSELNGIELFVNNNTTSTNYYRQGIYVSGSGSTSSRANDARISYIDYAGISTLAISNIKITNAGYFATQTDSLRAYNPGSTLWLTSMYSASTFTLTSMTQLSLRSNLANGIGAGLRFQLYRLKAKKVFDITLFSEMDYIDITGLDIDKGSEYMLVSDCANTTGGLVQFKLFPNNNLTDSNYYRQIIYASSTSVGAGRANNVELAYPNGSNNSLTFTKIKLTNAGYFITQTDESRNYKVGSAMSMTKTYVTSTFTATSITSLRILASVANGIGGGSRFTLYKMK